MPTSPEWVVLLATFASCSLKLTGRVLSGSSSNHSANRTIPLVMMIPQENAGVPRLN